MSQLDLKKIKLGDNADTSKNFVISVPAVADGTLTIERENGTDVLTIDANGVVVSPGNAQTWKNVTASRTQGSTYTNNTKLPIFVYYVGNAAFAASAVSFTVNGMVIGYSAAAVSNGNVVSGMFVVPAGATYSIAQARGTVNMATWMELQ